MPENIPNNVQQLPEPDYSQMSKEALHALLCPPAPPVDEKDIRLARGRYVVSELIGDVLMLSDALRALVAARNSDSVPLDSQAEREVQAALRFADRFNAQLEAATSKVDADPWDAFGGHFDAVWKDSLSAMHGGDCTAFPCSCERCHAEYFYGVPSSVSWSDKHEGYRLFEAWSKLVDDQK